MSLTHQNSRQWNRILLYSIKIPPISHFLHVVEIFTFFQWKSQKLRTKVDFLLGLLGCKRKISTKKQSRKIALKRIKRQLFGTNLDRNLVKTATFWDKVRTMNFYSTYPPLILQYKLMNILA